MYQTTNTVTNGTQSNSASQWRLPSSRGTGFAGVLGDYMANQSRSSSYQAASPLMARSQIPMGGSGLSLPTLNPPQVSAGMPEPYIPPDQGYGSLQTYANQQATHQIQPYQTGTGGYQEGQAVYGQDLGYGAGYGTGYSQGYNAAYGYGQGYGSNYGTGYGSGYGNGYGSAYGYNYGQGYGYGWQPAPAAFVNQPNYQTQPTEDSDAPSGGQPLGDSYSTYSGQRFRMSLSLGDEEQVGNNIEQFHGGHTVLKDGVYYNYFIDHTQGTQNDVGLATSTDGVNWTYQGKVLTKGESGGYDDLQASFPDVQYDEDTGLWNMLYEARSSDNDVNSVCWATSTDGVNWTKQGPIINPGDAGDLSDIDVGTPTMFKEDGVWHVYFHTFATDGRVRMGYAEGTSLDDLTVSQEPLLDTDATGYEGGTVGARSNVVKVGDYYYMAYEVCTPSTQFSESWWGTNIARAESPDGPWEKLSGGPLLKNSEQGFGTDTPELLAQDGKLYLYYRHGGNATARREITGLEGQGLIAMAGDQETKGVNWA